MIPCPPSLEYLPYQEEGIRFGKDRPVCLYGDEMGLGKTIQAIGWLNCHPEIESLLVVCPATLKVNWARELAKWLISPCVDVTIINYDQLHKLDLETREWDVCILDEGHYIKNPKARRSVLCRQIRAKYRLLLSGTPFLSRPIELWHPLHWLAPELWPANSYMKFAIRYCGAHQRRVRTHKGWRLVWDMGGATHLDELRMHLSYLMVRRLKKDVLKELPPKRRQLIELPTDGVPRRLEDLLKSALDEIRYWEETYLEDVQQLEAVVQSVWHQMAALRHEVGLLKVPMALEIIQDVLESTDKVVVFAHHRDVLTDLERGLVDYHPAVLHGGTPQAARQVVVDAFQTDPNCRVFLGQIQAAGTGITLTAASHVIFVELDWTPGAMSQAEDRCHRIGQRDSVLVQHLVLENSLDAHMAKMLIKKQTIIERTLDGNTNPKEEDVL